MPELEIDRELLDEDDDESELDGERGSVARCMTIFTASSSWDVELLKGTPWSLAMPRKADNERFFIDLSIFF